MSRGRIGGDLGVLGLPELVQTLTSGRKTARVLLRPGARHAELWFLEGELVHAATPTRFGDLAVYEMLEWRDGEFIVEYGATTDARSVTQDATFLMLEGCRRIDERPPCPVSLPAEQPVPIHVAAPEPVVVARVEPGPVPSSLVISGRSSGSGGTITVFVDGEAVLTRGPLENGAAFGAVIDVPPGEREVLARLRVENGVFEDTVRGDFASGESRTLRVTANRMLGSPVKLKLAK